jgi:PKD repeat protein
MSIYNFKSRLGKTTMPSSLGEGGGTIFEQFGKRESSFYIPNRYEVNLHLPSTLKSGQRARRVLNSVTQNTSTVRRVSLAAKTANLPGRSLVTVTNENIYGPTHDIATGQTYGDLSITFYMGQDFGERYFFEDWQKLTFNHDTFDLNYYNEYVGSIEIFALNKKDERMFGLEIEECFPDSIDGTDLSADATTSPAELTVQFKYRKFRNIGTERKAGEITAVQT